MSHAALDYNSQCLSHVSLAVAGSGCCTHSHPFNPQNKNWAGERKAKQIKSIPATTKLSIKPWKPEILDPGCWLIEYVFGIQDRWIFIYPFTYLGEMMRRQRGQIKKLHYQQLYSKFNALFS